ncbi:MAG TPA: hydrogenase maturation nickel metallochaperone HypA [Actinocrinis sp.]|nr:hydrogenase maturation nickel metallochaperone HypA [Actinocrinis sp.]
MHELSICRSVSGIVTKHAAGREVRIVRLRVGKLRQIVPDTLVYCWALVNEQTPLAGSRLEIESIAASIRCLRCGQTRELTEVRLVCDSCGGREVELATGEEFLITSLELAEE